MSVMKRDFIGKTVFLVAFVAILVVSVYGFSGKMMQERHNAQNKTSETTSDKQTDNNDLKTTGKTTEITTEKTTEPEEKDERKLPKATDKLVCFTFDDGPYAPVTNKILDTLEKYNGRATFFVVGDRADTYSDEIIRASKMGCEIGTHTYSHVNLNRLSVPEMQKEIKKSCDAISKYTGKKVKVLRPPEGAANDTVKANVGMPMVCGALTRATGITETPTRIIRPSWTMFLTEALFLCMIFILRRQMPLQGLSPSLQSRDISLLHFPSL